MDAEPPVHKTSDDDVNEWFDEDDEASGSPVDIPDIIKMWSKKVKKFHTPCAFKAFTELTAVMQYVKLREHYGNHVKCTHPCLTASLAIARWSGKGDSNRSYFAQKICANENYFQKHGQLPSKRVVFMAILPSSINKMLCLVFPNTSTPNHLAWSQQKHSVKKLTRLLFPPLASLANMQPFPNKPHETGCRNWVTHVLRCEKACTTMVMSGQMLLRKGGNSWMIWWNMRSESVYMSTYVKIKLTLQIHVYIQWCYNGASPPTTYSRWKDAHLAALGWRHCECEQAIQ